ncbi:MAG: DUF2066 domain-containing protein [Gammaproteobacteria bacterium]
MMHTIRVFFSLLTVFLAIICTTAWAASPVTDLYTARVLVTSRSDDARTAGFQAGLRQVYMKLSAKSDISSYKPLVQSLESAPEWVDRYQYQQSGNDAYMVIRFNQTLVKKALDDASLSYSDDPRPTLLVWLSMNVQDIPVILTEQQLSPEPLLVKKALLDAAARWGFDAQIPRGDPLDHVTPNDIAGAFDSPMHEASMRYHTDGYLALALTGKDDAWHDTWRTMVGEAKGNGTADGPLAAVFDNTFSQVAATYLHQAETVATTSPNDIELVVSHIDDLETYMRVDAYLNTLPGVKVVETVEMAMPTVTFRLKLTEPISTLEASLGAGRFLSLDDNPDNEHGLDTLYYRYESQ